MTTVCGRPEMPSHVRSPHWPISHCPLNSSLHLLYCLSNMLNSTLCKSQLIQTCPFSILSCWTPPALCRQNAQKHTWFRHVCTVSCFGRPVGCLSVSRSPSTLLSPCSLHSLPLNLSSWLHLQFPSLFPPSNFHFAPIMLKTLIECKLLVFSGEELRCWWLLFPEWWNASGHGIIRWIRKDMDKGW